MILIRSGRETYTEYEPCWPGHRVHIEWQRPLSGVHSIMMEKLAQPGEGGGCTPTLFNNIVNITYKIAVYALAEPTGADTLPLFHLYPYVLCGPGKGFLHYQTELQTFSLLLFCMYSMLVILSRLNLNLGYIGSPLPIKAQLFIKISFFGCVTWL
jgi:hypothetical protein